MRSQRRRSRDVMWNASNQHPDIIDMGAGDDEQEEVEDVDEEEEESPLIDLSASSSVRRRRRDAMQKAPSRKNDFYGELDSQQYEQEESEVWWHHQLQRHFQDSGHWWTFAKHTEFLRWLLTFVTGLSCGIVALLVTSLTQFFTHGKFRIFRHLLELEKERTLPFGTAFAFLFLCNTAFGLVAWLTVYVEPLAAGSGIPEVKCYLNGLNVPQLLDMRTLFCKAIGIVFACAAGLPLGKEGPMVHIGAIIAAGVSQGKSDTLGVEATFTNFQDLRNDREKRDFVACGSAAGVAAAFGAPVGGVLFSLEEGSSFWSTKLTWRCFFCAMTTVFFLYVFNTAKSLFGHSDITAMFSFGEFFSLQGEQSNYSVWELSMFIFIGYLGGLIGAFFNHFVLSFFEYRKQYIRSPLRKAVEILVLVWTMTLLACVLPLLWNKCTPLPINMDGWTDEEKQLVSELNPLYCNGETHYNELASLTLTSSDTSIRQLFHFREVGDHQDATFSSGALFVYFLSYLSLAALVCNTSTPAGMFVPSLLAGATFGRLVGHLLHKLDNTRGTFADSGTYALMGAAALTAGITRMTISLTVMILEATGDMQYVLPLMLTVMTARLVGNIFTEGIYDMHIHVRGLPYLDEDDDSFGRQRELHDLTVGEIMTREIVTLPSVVQVGQVWQVLTSGGHHCYPICDEKEPGILQGTIARKVLCTLLKHRAYSPSLASLDTTTPPSSPTARSRRENHQQEELEREKERIGESSHVSPLVHWGTLECVYPNYPDISTIHPTSSDRSAWLDLRPYIDKAPFILNQQASLQRTYRMFRTLGLRHLIVIDNYQHVVGMVTRSDIAAVYSWTHRQHSTASRRWDREEDRERRRRKEKRGGEKKEKKARGRRSPLSHERDERDGEGVEMTRRHISSNTASPSVSLPTLPASCHASPLPGHLDRNLFREGHGGSPVRRKDAFPPPRRQSSMTPTISLTLDGAENQLLSTSAESDVSDARHEDWDEEDEEDEDERGQASGGKERRPLMGEANGDGPEHTGSYRYQ